MTEIRFESLRLRYMRIVWVLLVIAVITGPAMALAITAMTRDATSPEAFLQGVTSSTSVAMTRGPFAVSISLLLGMLVASRDLRRGASGTTMVLFPRRGRLYAARLLVIGLAAAVIAGATVALSFGAVTLALPADASVEPWVVIRVAGLFVLAQTCFAVMGAALALLTRSAGAAAAVGFGWILIVEPMVRFAVLATGRLTELAEYLPVAAANAMAHSLSAGSAANEPELLSATPTTAAFALLGLTAALAVWGWVDFRTRPLVHG